MLIQKSYLDFIEEEDPLSIVLIYMEYATLYTLESNGNKLEVYDFSVANQVYCRDTAEDILLAYRELLDKKRRQLDKGFLTPIKVGDKVKDVTHNKQYSVIKISAQGFKISVREDTEVRIMGNSYYITNEKGEVFTLSRGLKDVLTNTKKKYIKYEHVSTSKKDE